MKEYKGYLFDADGTLFDTQEMIYQCFRNTFTLLGRPVPPRDFIISMTGIPLVEQVDKFFSPRSDDERSAIIKAHSEYQALIYKDYLRLFPNTIDVLGALCAAGKKLAVVTSRKRDTLIPYLRETGIERFFNAFITPETTEKHKPDPEPAFAALDAIDCDPCESLFIGDTIWDLECGSRAGTDTAFVGWSGADPSSFHISPTWTIDDYRDLLAW